MQPTTQVAIVFGAIVVLILGLIAIVSHRAAGRPDGMKTSTKIAIALGVIVAFVFGLIAILLAVGGPGTPDGGGGPPIGV
jgi:hypothetical protein